MASIARTFLPSVTSFAVTTRLRPHLKEVELHRSLADNTFALLRAATSSQRVRIRRHWYNLGVVVLTSKRSAKTGSAIPRTTMARTLISYISDSTADQTIVSTSTSPPERPQDLMAYEQPFQPRLRGGDADDEEVARCCCGCAISCLASSTRLD